MADSLRVGGFFVLVIAKCNWANDPISYLYIMNICKSRCFIRDLLYVFSFRASLFHVDASLKFHKFHSELKRGN